MVQVDIFWSYGFGATFALIAARAIKHEYQSNPVSAQENQFYNKPFVLNLIFLSCFFVPSGIWLLWGWPDWETMMVFPDHESLPFWFVTAFAVTNMTQGILGYWLTRKLIIKNQFYKAYLHFWGANFAFWIVLIHGWDGTGIWRFFGTSYETFHSGEQVWYDWFFSTPFWGLVALGPLVMGPLFLMWQKLWNEDLQLERNAKEGLEEAQKPMKKALLDKLKINSFGGYMLATIMSCIGLAAIVSIIFHLVGLFIGLPIAMVLIYLTAVKPEGALNLNYRFYKMMMYMDAPVHTLNLSQPRKLAV